MFFLLKNCCPPGLDIDKQRYPGLDILFAFSSTDSHDTECWYIPASE